MFVFVVVKYFSVKQLDNRKKCTSIMLLPLDYPVYNIVSNNRIIQEFQLQVTMCVLSKIKIVFESN